MKRYMVHVIDHEKVGTDDDDDDDAMNVRPIGP